MLAPRWTISPPSGASPMSSATTSGSASPSASGSYRRASRVSSSSPRSEVVQKPERRHVGTSSAS